MANLRATRNYVFTTDDLIGRGATCEVYRGINKHTGEVHALKIFDHRHQLAHISKREIEALRRLKHENIVDFLGEEYEGSRVVAVMEHCSKSLYNMLCEPENRYGLNEEEFMRFFKHIVAGMKHLREHDFLHRDIKPGNILVAQDDDGSYIYKLSDFGTAKPVMETEAFQSLVGTEEYLHPDIFRAAFIDNHMQRRFDAAADLWSVGATLYHAATGKVPFQPYDGRGDRRVMFDMIARKDHGVISGEQKKFNGNIEWSRELPKSCNLSRWLKQALTQIMAGLLEGDARMAWNFDQFFAAADDIVRRQVLHVFSTSSAKHFPLYLELNAVYADVQKGVYEETGVPEENQQIRYEECLLKDIVDLEDPVSTYPKTTLLVPIIVISSLGLSDCVIPEEAHLWYKECRPGPPPVFDKVVRLDFDAGVSKGACDGIAMIQSRVQLSCITQELFAKIISTTERWTDVLISHFSKELDLCRERLKDLSHITKVIQSDCNGQIIENGRNTKELKERLKKCCKIRDTIRETKMKASGDHITSCREENSCDKKIARLLQQAKEKRDVLQARRKHRSLPFHEEQLHMFDRKEVRNLFERSSGLWSSHCVNRLSEVHQHFLTWHSKFTELQVLIETLQMDFMNLRRDIRGFVNDFKISSPLSEQVEVDCPPVDGRHSLTRQKKQILAASLDEVKSGQQEIKELISLNTELCNKSMELMTTEGDLKVMPNLNNLHLVPHSEISNGPACTATVGQRSPEGEHSNTNVTGSETDEDFTFV